MSLPDSARIFGMDFLKHPGWRKEKGGAKMPPPTHTHAAGLQKQFGKLLEQLARPNHGEDPFCPRT